MVDSYVSRKAIVSEPLYIYIYIYSYIYIYIYIYLLV